VTVVILVWLTFCVGFVAGNAWTAALRSNDQ